MRAPSADITFEATDDRRTITTGALRLAFAWTGDRWSHQIEVRDPGGSAEPGAWRLLARSLEADPQGPAAERIVSPAYQQFHHQFDDTGCAAMLLGQSGPHHFSAVFHVREAGGGTEIEIDLADRCRAEVEALACTYELAATSSALAEAEPERVAWRFERVETNGAAAHGGPPGAEQHAAGAGTLNLLAQVPARIFLAEAGRSGTRAQVLAGLEPGQHTQRCQYRWTWRWTTQNTEPCAP